MNSYPSCPAMVWRSARKRRPASVTGAEWKNFTGGSGPPNTRATRSPASGPWIWYRNSRGSAPPRNSDCGSVT